MNCSYHAGLGNESNIVSVAGDSSARYSYVVTSTRRLDRVFPSKKGPFNDTRKILHLRTFPPRKSNIRR